jgi:hypothetical protein
VMRGFRVDPCLVEYTTAGLRHRTVAAAQRLINGMPAVAEAYMCDERVKSVAVVIAPVALLCVSPFTLPRCSHGGIVQDQVKCRACNYYSFGKSVICTWDQDERPAVVQWHSICRKYHISHHQLIVSWYLQVKIESELRNVGLSYCPILSVCSPYS